MSKSIFKALLTGLLMTLVFVSGVRAETAKNAFVVLNNRNGVLNVRTAPVDGEVVAYLGDGRDVVILETVDGWALVCNPGDYDDPMGWASLEYLHVYGGGVEYGRE